MDYIAKKEDGHWKCILITNMYFLGDLREGCELTLCYIPRPIFSMLTYFFGETTFKNFKHPDGTSYGCSRCGAVFYCFLAPFAFALALVIITVIIALILVFLPVFVVAILPCVIFVKCRQSSSTNVTKKSQDMVDNDNDHDDDEDITNANAGGDEGEEFPLKPPTKPTITPIIITKEPKPANGGSCRPAIANDV